MGLLRRVNVLGIGVILLVIAFWQLAATVGPFSDFSSLPSPLEVVTGFRELVETDSLVDPVVHTIGVALTATAIGVISGGFFGVLLGLWPGFRLLTGSSFDVLRTIPVVSIMPVLLLVLGAEMRTEVIVGAIASTWPMLVNTTDGVRAIHPRLGEVGRMFRFSRVKSVVRLTLPAIVPSLLVGVRLAAVTALIATIVAEMIIVPSGIGWSLITAQNSLQISQEWALVVVCGWLGWIFNVGLTTLVNRIQPGQVR